MQQIIDIVGWVKDKPKFWQSAIETLIRSNNISEDNFFELLEICKAEHGLGVTEIAGINFENLCALAASTDSQDKVILSKISDVSNINALSRESTIEFHPTGVTAIYGDNGAGKSSLTGILKHVCSTRGKKPKISSNLFDADSSRKDQLAKVSYTFDNQTLSEVEFRNNAISDTILKCINVFDSSSANNYIDSEDEIAYVPQGILILEKFAGFLKKMELHLKTEKDALTLSKFDHSLLQIRESSKAMKFLQGLNRKTTLQELRDNSAYTKDCDSEIDGIKAAIDDLTKLDPGVVIKANKDKIDRFNVIVSKLEKIEEQLYGEEIKKAGDLLAELATSHRAVALVQSEDVFSNLPLTGVGGELWKKLWESARTFYNFSVTTEVFPELEDNSVCPLCLQALDDAAKSRFLTFEDYVKQDLQQKYEDIRGEVIKVKLQIEDIDIDFEELMPTINELDELSPGYKQTHSSYLMELQKRKDYLAGRFSNIEEGELVLPAIQSKATDAIIAQIGTLQKINLEVEAKSIENELKTLNEKLHDLLEMKTVWTLKPKLAREIFRLIKENKLDNCITKCNTRTVTVLSNTLSNTYITNGLQESLRSELTKLGFDYVGIETETKGAAGKQYHYLRLSEENAENIKLKDILSEGEHRCIALAAFLSELSLSHQPGAIVFDDPVSSLDHKWRNRIAKRLVEEAQVRQIIIFTHDITFLHMIEQYHERVGGDLKIVSLTRKRKETGLSLANPPWDTLSLKLRIGVLKTLQQDLGKVGRQGTEEDFKEGAKILYGRLREAWERFIEEVFLNGAIQRFGREVQTKRLEKIVDLTIEDYKTVDYQMSKCSIHFLGHDTAGELNEAVPNSDEMLEDIIALEKFAAEIRNRRK